VSRTAARTLCNFSLRTASGPEGSSAKQTLRCTQVHRVAVGLIERKSQKPKPHIPKPNVGNEIGFGFGS